MYQTEIVDRVRSAGVHSASVIDLLAVGMSTTEEQANRGEEMARGFLKRHISIQRMADMAPSDIKDATALNPFEVLRVLSLIELGRRVASAGRGEPDTIYTAKDVPVLLSYLHVEKREHFVAVLLDAQSQVMRVATIHIGTLMSSHAAPREVFREAIREGAASVIVAHNHPSGDPTPSQEDIAATRMLVEAGKLMDIEVLDHVILGYRKWTSMKTLGLI
ncbi:MAG: JAB domain-containing protein [Fimbriimonas sp.]